MLQVTVEEGQPVRKGALLGRIEARDSRRRRHVGAVGGAVRRKAAAGGARREAQRTEQLVDGGALAARDLDIARNAVVDRRGAARRRARPAGFGASSSSATRSSARRSHGIVSRQRRQRRRRRDARDRRCSRSSTRRRMRLEASVPSDQLAALRVGAPVRVHRPRLRRQPFDGPIERISPPADPTTRQVPIFVSHSRTPAAGWSPASSPKAASSAEARQAWSCRSTRSTRAQRTRGDARERTARPNGSTSTLGLRDQRTERVEIVAGVNEGDILLRGAAQGITPGTPVTSVAPRPTTGTQVAMFISDFAIKRPVITVVTMLALVVFGIVRAAQARDRRVPGCRSRRSSRRDPVSRRVARQSSSAKSSTRSRRRSPAISGVDQHHVARRSTASRSIIVEFVFEKDLQRGDAGDSRRDLGHPQRSAAGDGGADPHAVRSAPTCRSSR